MISTLHTIDCMETINRMLDLFPPQQQKEVRSSFAGALRGIVSQRLVPRSDGKGRVPACEILINTGRVFDRIVDPDTTDQIVDVIADGEFYGMQTFDQALVRLVRDGLVSEDEARRTATSPHDFDLLLHGVLDRHSAFDLDGPVPTSPALLVVLRVLARIPAGAIAVQNVPIVARSTAAPRPRPTSSTATTR